MRTPNRKARIVCIKGDKSRSGTLDAIPVEYFYKIY